MISQTGKQRIQDRWRNETKRTLNKSHTHDKKLHPMDAGSTARNKSGSTTTGYSIHGGWRGGGG